MVASATEVCLGESFAVRVRFDFIHILSEPAEFREILVKKLLRLLPRRPLPQTFAKRVHPHPVHNSEVDDFGLPPHLFCNIFKRYAENLGSNGSMHILSFLKNLYELRVA